MRKIGYYLSIACYDTLLRIFFIILILKLLFFHYIIQLGSLSFLSDLGVILLVLSFSLFMRKKSTKIMYLTVMDVLFSLILFSTALYRKHFGDFITAFSIDQLPMLKSIADQVFFLIDREYLFFIDLLFLPVLSVKRVSNRDFNIKDKAKAVLILFFLGLYLNLTIFSNLLMGFNFSNFAGERDTFVSHFGIINYQVFDMYSYVTTKTIKANVAQSDMTLVQHWIKGRNDTRSSGHEYTGVGKGFNVVFIQAESLQNFIIGKRYNGREITPNLNSLASKGIIFTGIFDQTAAGSSSDATLLSISSLYPARRGSASYLYAHNCYDSLPKVLRDNGYETAVMHPNAERFWNSGVFEKSLGFDHQFYDTEYDIVETIGIGLSDRAFFMQSADKMKIFSTPFFVLLRTLSAHFPFYYVTEKNDDFPVGSLEGKTTGHYIRTMHYMDGAIGEFMKKLDEYDMLSKTIIVIYGDHRAHLNEEDLEALGVRYERESEKIALLISIPGRSYKDERDTIGGLVDIAPTVSTILGVDISDKFFLGRDLISAAEGFVIFRDGSLIGEKKSGDGLYPGEVLAVSDIILEKDIIPKIRNLQECDK
jgi:phosphoglycerol transferase MdoB-like AlkP superfamily enzyme